MVASFNFHGAKVTGILNRDGTESQITSVVVNNSNILGWLEAEPDLNTLLLEKLDQLLQEEVK